jgi:hypothetical protein
MELVRYVGKFDCCDLARAEFKISCVLMSRDRMSGMQRCHSFEFTTDDLSENNLESGILKELMYTDEEPVNVELEIFHIDGGLNFQQLRDYEWRLSA